MRTPLLILTVIALCMWTLPAHAQQEAESSVTESESIVRVTLQSQIRSEPDALAPMPMSLIERLSDQPSLTRLDVETGRKTQLSARFVFESVEAFKQWYNSTSTQEMIGRLNEGRNQAMTNLTVQVARERHPNQ